MQSIDSNRYNTDPTHIVIGKSNILYWHKFAYCIGYKMSSNTCNWIESCHSNNSRMKMFMFVTELSRRWISCQDEWQSMSLHMRTSRCMFLWWGGSILWGRRGVCQRLCTMNRLRNFIGFILSRIPICC